jgi:tetratricopeptide (TPR) repeat protein
MTGMRRLASFAVAALVFGVTPALAEGSAESKRAFEDGRKSAEAHDYPKAIEAFERSVALDPSIGGNFNLAFCYEQVKRPDDALSAYRRAAAIAQKANDARLKDVSGAIKRLLDANEWIALRTPPEVAAAPGLQVELDGKPVPKTELNGEVIRPAAPAGHTVKVTATGRSDAATASVASHATFVVALGPALEAAPPPAPGATAAPAPGGTPPMAGRDAASSGGWGWQKWTGVGLASAGVVSAAVGVVLFVKYRADGDALQREADDRCRDGACRGAGRPTADAFFHRAEDLDADATRNSIITFGLGGALAVGGAILFLTAPSSSAPPPSSAARLQLIPHVGVANGLSAVGSF